MRARFLPSVAFVAIAIAAACGSGTNGAGVFGGGTGGDTSSGSSTSTSSGATSTSTSSGASSSTSTSSGSSSTSTSSGGGGSPCSPGTADCNGNAADGCEAVISADPKNCGACGKACAAGAVCSGGICGIACGAGLGDCNGNAADGCEANLGADPKNCGMCGVDCMGAACVQGACACAAETQKANLVQLDLYIMLDQSGSMSDTVQGGGTKWQSVTTALNAFFSDPASAGIGVGIQYFALPAGGGGCPPVCATAADCGGTPCFFGMCILCAGGGNDSCVAADYAKPEVEIAPLNAAQASTLSTSIGGHMPSTNTPTSAALDGAIQHAEAWGAAHPSHVAIVVFVTDGDPTECDLNQANINAFAAAGVAAVPSTKTFVIGVGSSLSALNGIAAAGGTGQAFLVDTNANVVAQFEAALKALQKSAVGCQYTIPQPMMGQLDYAKVNVQYTPSNGPVELIPNVASKAACDPNTGGWYYDNNAAPTQILLCPVTCAKVSSDPTAKVDVLLGCATMHN